MVYSYREKKRSTSVMTVFQESAFLVSLRSFQQSVWFQFVSSIEKRNTTVRENLSGKKHRTGNQRKHSKSIKIFLIIGKELQQLYMYFMQLEIKNDYYTTVVKGCKRLNKTEWNYALFPVDIFPRSDAWPYQRSSSDKVNSNSTHWNHLFICCKKCWCILALVY